MHQLIMYGGAFNPPHLDHIGIIDTLLATTTEKVLIIPTGKRNDKQYSGARDADREAMIRLSTESYSRGVEVDTTFLYGNMPTTTLAQATYLREKYGREIAQVFGSDTAPRMMEWDMTGYVAYRLPKVFVTRPDHPLDGANVANYSVVEYASRGFSSTAVREEVSRILGKYPVQDSVSRLMDSSLLRDSIHENVLRYIGANRLFSLSK